METDFAPTGELRLRQIVEAVMAEGDAVEGVGLEVKSDIDPSAKGLGSASCWLGLMSSTQLNGRS